MEANNNRKLLVDTFVQTVSKQIPLFIEQHLPGSSQTELSLFDAETLINSFVNFAAINAAVIGQSVIQLDGKNILSKEETTEFLLEKCQEVFKTVFTENMLNYTEEKTK